MEELFDRIQDMQTEKTEDEIFMESVRLLLKYYQSGQWLADYESDERGELPKELKRGVLSQDGIDHLLHMIKEKGIKIE